MYDVPGIYFTFIAMLVTFGAACYVSAQVGRVLGKSIGKQICKYLDKKQLKAHMAERHDLNVEFQKLVVKYSQLEVNDKTFKIFFGNRLNQALAVRIHMLDKNIRALDKNYQSKPYMPAGARVVTA
jgi:hypothetical protein